MVVLSAMVNVLMYVHACSDVQRHGWGPPFGRWQHAWRVPGLSERGHGGIPS